MLLLNTPKFFDVNVRYMIGILLVISFGVSVELHAQNTPKVNTINIDFGEKKFKNLELIVSVDAYNDYLYFTGKNLSGNIWEFSYPDSLYNNIQYFSINDGRSKDTIAHSIDFLAIEKTDTSRCASYIFSRGNVRLKCPFVSVQTYSDLAYRNKEEKVIYKTSKDYQFLIEERMDKEVFISALSMGIGYSWFNNSHVGSQKKYIDNLDSYILLTKRFPSSMALLSSLGSKVQNYENKSDLAKVYHAFSDSVLDTYFAKKIKRYIDFEHFDNMMLTDWSKKKMEPIITDFSKFSLIIFSASWCTPCHEQIPIVRELEKQVGGKLNIIYISIDEKSTAESWRSMVKKDEIPGRSLMALDQNRLVKGKYYVSSIPYTLLVSPEGTLKVVDIRVEKVKKRIVERLSSKK